MKEVLSLCMFRENRSGKTVEISEKEAERRRKISMTMTGHKKPRSVVEKVTNANRGQKRSKEVVEATRARAIKQFSDPAMVEKTRQAAIRQWADPEKRARGVAANRKIAADPVVRKKRSEIMKELWKDDKYRQRAIGAHRGQPAWNKGVPWTDEYRANVIAAINKPEVLKIKREKSKLLWQDGSYVKKLQQAYHRKPNKPETILLTLLNDLYPNEWKYTGDLSFMINGKNPDFVNCNGKKLVIEMWGDYWHKGEDPKDRAKVFKPFGYETLVIWERELKNPDKVISRIRDFVDHTEATMYAVK